MPNEDLFSRGSSARFRKPVKPVVDIPAGACDTHLHIVGPLATYPLMETRTFQPHEALLEDYLSTAKMLGLERMVVVQPSSFGMDNSCTLAAVAARGLEKARAVVVVSPGVTGEEMHRLHQRGARGVRLMNLVTGALGLEHLERIAALIAPLGMHIQTYLDSSDIPALLPRIKNLPVDIVFDHMAHVNQERHINDVGFQALLQLMADGKGWVKLSNARFPPSRERAIALLGANPKRALWGSDWPHIAYQGSEAPDDGRLLQEFADWIGNVDTLKTVLVDNPEQLYFDS